tara:strand:+ start:319 stop:477 length:159 start_codon:yes stop_codon:yes gene_type:complete
MELVFVALIITATLIKELSSQLNSGDGGGAHGRLSQPQGSRKEQRGQTGMEG